MTCGLGSYYYDLYPMNDKMFNDFLVGKSKGIMYAVKARLCHDLYFVYVV